MLVKTSANTKGAYHLSYHPYPLINATLVSASSHYAEFAVYLFSELVECFIFFSMHGTNSR